MVAAVPCRCKALHETTSDLPKGTRLCLVRGPYHERVFFCPQTDESLPCHSGVGVKLDLPRDTSQVGTGRGYSVLTTRFRTGPRRAKVETIPGFGRAAATPGFPALRVNGNTDLGNDSTLRALCLVAFWPVLPYRTTQQNPTDNAYIYLSGLIPSVSGTSLRLVQHNPHRTECRTRAMP